MIFEKSFHNLKHQLTKEMFPMPVVMSSVESLGLWVRASVVGVVPATQITPATTAYSCRKIKCLLTTMHCSTDYSRSIV